VKSLILGIIGGFVGITGLLILQETDGLSRQVEIWGPEGIKDTTRGLILGIIGGFVGITGLLIMLFLFIFAHFENCRAVTAYSRPNI
jgi:hypothetical protein